MPQPEWKDTNSQTFELATPVVTLDIGIGYLRGDVTFALRINERSVFYMSLELAASLPEQIAEILREHKDDKPYDLGSN